MALEKFTFLDEVGIQKLSEALLTKVNSRVAERIVQEISDASDANHVASAALLNSLLKTRDALISGNTTAAATNKTSIDGVVSDIADLETKVDTNTTDITSASNDIKALDEKVDAFTHLTIDVVTGKIDTVADPQTDILYFQRDDESDTTWMLYIYREDGSWVQIGDTGVDLSGYWSKDDNDKLKETIGVPEATPLAEAKILAAIDAAFVSTKLYSLTINGGNDGCTPNGLYAAGTNIQLVGENKGGYSINWITSGVVLENPSMATQSFTMPAADVVVTLQYKENPKYYVNLVSPEYGCSINPSTNPIAEGTLVTVKANTNATTATFTKWSSNSANIVFADATSGTTTFIMPGEHVTITAEYTHRYLNITEDGTVTGNDFLKTTCNETYPGMFETTIGGNSNYTINGIVPKRIGPNAFDSFNIHRINITQPIQEIDSKAFENCPVKQIHMNFSEGSIPGAPWGAPNATVNWKQ